MSGVIVEDRLPSGEAPDDPTGAEESVTEARVFLIENLHMLEDALAADPSLAADIEIILSEHLGRPQTTDTISMLGAGLEICIGFESAQFLVDVLRNSNPDQVGLLKRESQERTWRWLRRLIALHSDSMQLAYAKWNENPHGWQSLEPRLGQDLVSLRWWYGLTINKYDGTRVYLEDTLVSMLSLARNIVRIATAISREDLELLLPDDEVLKEIQQVVNQLVEAYNTPPDETADVIQEEGVAIA